MSEQEYPIVAPYRTTCSKGHLLADGNETRSKTRSYNKIYLRRVCRICAKEYGQQRRKKISSEKARRLTKKGTKPSMEELSYLMGLYTWTDLGKRFGVSDVSVRKWALSYNLLGRKDSADSSAPVQALV